MSCGPGAAEAEGTGGRALCPPRPAVRCRRAEPSPPGMLPSEPAQAWELLGSRRCLGAAGWAQQGKAGLWLAWHLPCTLASSVPLIGYLFGLIIG